MYRVLLAALAVISACLYALDDWRRYETYRSAGYDVGIFDQAIRHYARVEAPVSSLKGVGFSLLGDHFSPILAVIASLFWIWRDTRMLDLVLGALVAASVFPVYSFSERRLGPGLALMTTAAYVFWWPVQGLVAFDFHEIAFADARGRPVRVTVVGGTALAGNLYPLRDVFTAQGWASTARTRAAGEVVARMPPRVRGGGRSAHPAPAPRPAREPDLRERGLN